MNSKEQYLSWDANFVVKSMRAPMPEEIWQAAQSAQAAELEALRAKAMLMITALNDVDDYLSFAPTSAARTALLAIVRSILANTDTAALKELRKKHYLECAEIANNMGARFEIVQHIVEAIRKAADHDPT